MAEVVRLSSGTPRPTYQVASTDTAQSLAAAKITQTKTTGDSAGVHASEAQRAVITVESDEIRVAFNTDPTENGGTGLGHIFFAKAVIVLEGAPAVKGFRFVSADAGSHANLQVTVEF